MTPSFSDFLERDSTEKLREELEDAYDLLNRRGELDHINIQDHINNELEQSYYDEVSEYGCSSYDQRKDEGLMND